MIGAGGAGDGAAQPKQLANLKDDPAFREFFKLQEGFEWNGKRENFPQFLAARGEAMDWENWKKNRFLVKRS